MLSLTQKGQYYQVCRLKNTLVPCCLDVHLALSQVFLAQAVGMGLGLGLAFLPSLSIVSHHFRVHRALATGIVVTGASCGGIVFPIMLNHLFSNPNIGFANGVRASGGLIAVLLVLANMMMKTSCVGKMKKTNSLTMETARAVVKDGAYMISIVGRVPSI